MFTIESLRGLEILDSRGRPTVKATCHLANGAVGAASVPSGASTGRAEALELRDGDARRYRGLGCRQAAANIHTALHVALAGRTFPDQAALDTALLETDGTSNKSRLGANALLAVSLAFARAAAVQTRIPLYRYFAGLAGLSSWALPQLTINLFSGGKHAGGQAPLQDVLIAPVAARSIEESLATAYAVYQSAADLIKNKYGMRLLRADEGGLAPPFGSAQAMLEDALAAISAAGLQPGRDVALAVDAAATHFFSDNRYHLGPETVTSKGMIDILENWCRAYPIISLEDGLAEDDWEHWPELCQRLSKRCLVLGDDLLCTNPQRIRKAIDSRAANALLLKVNQVGTLTEAAEALQLARSAGWHVTVSARSGETEDDWLADLAVGWNANHLKIGSITQSERLSKYNRLLEIEANMQREAPAS